MKSTGAFLTATVMCWPADSFPGDSGSAGSSGRAYLSFHKEAHAGPFLKCAF